MESARATGSVCSRQGRGAHTSSWQLLCMARRKCSGARGCSALGLAPQERNRRTLVVHVIQKHAVALEHLDPYLRLRMLASAQELVDAYRRALAVAHTVDDQPRPEGDIARREYSAALIRLSDLP